MTKQQYRHMCQIKVNRLTKFITYCTLMAFFSIAYYVGLSGYITAAISTTIWLYMPDLAAYVLECFYEIDHDLKTYR